MIIPTLTEKLNKPFQKAVESELSFGRNSALKWQYLINEPNRKYPKLISQHDLETNKYSVQSEQELRDLAELNLNKLEVNLTKHQDLVSSDNIEIILSTEQMVKVHELLSSEQIFVSASRKGWFRAIPYNTGSEQACGFYEEHRGHAFFASNPPTKNILLFDKGTIQYEISNLHFLMVTNNTSDFKHMASKEIFQYDRGYECVYTGKSNDNFFKIFKKVINEEISTFHFVEVRVGDEPLETIQINGNNIEKGTELYFEYAFEKIDDPKLKEQIKDCIEYRLRYLLLDLPELKNDHLPDYNLERFTISDIHSLMK